MFLKTPKMPISEKGKEAIAHYSRFHIVSVCKEHLLELSYVLQHIFIISGDILKLGHIQGVLILSNYY